MLVAFVHAAGGPGQAGLAPGILPALLGLARRKCSLPSGSLCPCSAIVVSATGSQVLKAMG